MAATPDTIHRAPPIPSLLGRWVAGNPKLWVRLGNMESMLLAGSLPAMRIASPVYVCGLARSGSTLLLEILAACTAAASHRYQDFPFVFTPYWWNTVLKYTPFQNRALRERAHGDGMMVNAQSPEAMEEMLWAAFFPESHDPSASQVLDAHTRNAAFERFYPDHIRKLLLVRKAERYVSKGNYNVTRMRYLLTLFPDARFIIPIRKPEEHIASLMRQHQRFCEAGKREPGIAAHMQSSGHFEFGPGRKPINTGDKARLDAVMEAWAKGEEVAGWALYWDMLHDFIHRQLEADPALKRAAMTVPFETLCESPRETVAQVLGHCRLDSGQSADNHALRIRRPDYYSHGFTDKELGIIAGITQATARKFGY